MSLFFWDFGVVHTGFPPVSNKGMPAEARWPMIGADDVHPQRGRDVWFDR